MYLEQLRFLVGVAQVSLGTAGHLLPPGVWGGAAPSTANIPAQILPRNASRLQLRADNEARSRCKHDSHPSLTVPSPTFKHNCRIPTVVFSSAEIKTNWNQNLKSNKF